MALSDATMIVQLGPVRFDRTARRPWVVQKLEGWYDLSDSKTAFDERPQGHGAFTPGQDWRASAAVSIAGRFHASSMLEAAQMKAQINAMGGPGGLVPLTVTDELGQASRLVSIRRTTVDPNHTHGWFNFAIDCLAPDPRRYSPAQVVSQQLGLSPGDNLAINPSFETGVTGWSALVDGVAKAVTQGAVSAFAGSKIGLVTLTAPASTVVVKSSVTLAPSVADRVHLRVRPSTPRPLRLALTVLAGTDVLETRTTADPVQCVGASWNRLLVDLDNLPAGATRIVAAVDSTDGSPWAAGETLAVDALMVGAIDDYADGDTPGWQWSGTPGASSSVSREFLEVTNIGTAVTEPTITIAGGMPDGFTLVEVETSRQLEFTQPIPTGATTVIDARRRKIFVNGVVARGLIKHQWPTVPPGATRRYFLTVPGARTSRLMTVALAPAWW